MLPQTGITTTRSLTEIPSKTYKLNINEDDTGIYTLDYKNMVRFEFESHDLIVYFQSLDADISFEIEDGDLIIESEKEELLQQYSLEGTDVIFETKIYGDRIMGTIDKLNAVRQAVYHILMTERYSYLIYSNNYGVELRQYIGKDFNYLQATIENTLREALTYDLRIKNIEIQSIKKENDKAIVKFIVYSIYGDLQMEVNISV